jgi:hypothetical protein
MHVEKKISGIVLSGDGGIDQRVGAKKSGA